MSLLLIVDDDELVRASVAAILANLGHEILQARNGLEALDIVREKQDEVQLIVMDIMMPIMDGIQATRAIKSTHPASRIILMSGYTESLPDQAQADAFISKPFRTRDLCDLVQKMLGEAG